MYDEPFAGLDPISLGVVGQLIRRLNDALGITSLVVTHDVYESLKIVDYLYFVSEGKIIAQGTPAEVRASGDPFVRQFVDGEPDGPVPFHYPARAVPLRAVRPCLARRRRVAHALRRLGGTTDRRHRLARATRRASASRSSARRRPRFARLRLTLREIYFSGVLSLVIILVSGLFVGMVLALQGYDVLQRYGAAESLGVLVALSLVRELGPVVAGLLFASRAGSAITAEIGLMKATEQLSAMEMMAVDPLARVVAPRFWGGVISMPLLAALFSTLGVFGAYLVGVKLIGIDAGAFWGNMQAGVDFSHRHRQRRHQERRFRRRGQPDRGVRGLRREADRRGRVDGDDAHGRRELARDPRRSTSSSPCSCSGAWREVDREAAHEPQPLRTRSLGRHLRRDRHRRDPVSRAQGRQPDQLRVDAPGYRLEARFDNIGGLKLRAPVKAAGVVVGRVERIRLDPTTYQAVVTLKIDQGYQFTTDTIASILTSGLLGEVYIGLDAGGDTKMLADGGKLAKTQSAVVLEKLIGQFLFDKAATGGGK